MVDRDRPPAQRDRDAVALDLETARPVGVVGDDDDVALLDAADELHPVVHTVSVLAAQSLNPIAASWTRPSSVICDGDQAGRNTHRTS